ncbi:MULTISPECIES: restriction endonuclease subunit S [Acetobacter]|nr:MULTISPECIES: restriction endonuclease subunit S [Acetobacter]ATI12675.1 restriction endonuclease subunit S [Acetobacter pomorum]AXC27189.1 restriction endonuclease subunit S [Acetobacter sp. JWB]KAA8422518.1 restriction endonuclease subunit S [Acetobacter pomorum]KAA8431224.1 restriction endonuclease subunit S [Acetobacter pomorum]KAA8448280.1 restriction endonuclease subunit S [Acetobacter pomorum]
MKKWPLSTISAVADVFDGPHATPKTIDHGAIFLGIDSLDHGRLNLSSTRHVTNEDFKKWTKRVKPEAGDIVFSYETRLGEVAIIPEGLVCCLGRRMALIRTDRSVLNEKFFLYYFMSPQFQEQIRKNTINGATVDRIPLKEFPSFKLELPPLDEQHTIASILGSLDDKIDLNRRTNETLEAMARALFRDWFVDFGPTRAKMAGEAPYLAPELWELFPDRLDDEGNPEGWQSWPLADLAILSKSSINPAQFSDEYFLHFSLPAFDKGMMPDLVKGEEIKSGKFSVSSNSILLSKLNPETPRVWMVTAHEEPYQRICSTEFMVLNPLQKDWLALIYCACLSQPFRETLQGMVTGTSKSHQRVQPLAVMQTHLLHATDILMRQFDLTAQPLLAKMNFNRNESNTLAQLRDLLLPKLMSGEISIRDAEKMVEDAA